MILVDPEYRRLLLYALITMETTDSSSFIALSAPVICDNFHVP